MIIHRSELPGSATSWQFEGYLHQDVPVSFFVNETPPGRGPSLHQHPYPEVFIVIEGTLTFTVGDETIVATGNQIIIAPANTPHKFINSGTTPTRHVDIHTSAQMVTTWLEE